MKRLLFAAAMTLAAWAPQVRAAPEYVGEPPACGVAWSQIEGILREMNGRQVVFSDQNFLFLERPDPSTRWAAEGDGRATVAPPAAELVQALRAQNPVQACPSIRRRLEARRIRFGREAVEWALGGNRRFYRATIVTLSMPSVSADGGQAVMGRSQASRRPGSGASLVHLVRDERGAWHVAASIGLYVS